MAWVPDQSVSLGLADAEHEVAFVLDHVSVAVCPCVIELDDAVIVTVGTGGGGGVPPPPPQALIRLKLEARNRKTEDFFMMFLPFNSGLCAHESLGQGMLYPMIFTAVRWPAAGAGNGPKVKGLPPTTPPPLINTSGGREPPALNWTAA